MKSTKVKHLFKLSVLSITVGLVMASCNKDEEEMDEQDPVFMSSTYNYEFHNGQTVESAPYNGPHMSNLSAKMMVEEISNSETKITITLQNTVDGEMYMIHAHDGADPANTPNGTPYDENPNDDVFNQHVTGNGGDVSVSQTVQMMYSDITDDYDGFLVVHDPLQNISTTDISTYLIVGAFAREQVETNYASTSFNYDFNTGQVNQDFAYEGDHMGNLSAMLKIEELAGGKSRVFVSLINSISGETYMVHAHDMADPENTPNGTPYDETPNENVLSLMINGNSGTVGFSQTSTMSYNDLINDYEAFIVVHDPLQDISTTDPTTYVILGVFAN